MTENNSNIIKNIVIVGGGTAGWLSAAYLNRALNYSHKCNCKITLIESSDIPTVGVGESTLPSLAKTFEYLGLSELDWMTKCNATYKLAIKFVNWSNLPDRKEYWHPFGQLPLHKGIPLSNYWLKEKLQGNSTSFSESCFDHVHLCNAKKSPKVNPYSQIYSYEKIKKIPYGYHLDAGLLAEYLRNISKVNGVEQIVDKVVDVHLDKQGFIEYLTTEEYGNLYGDLFIDCSGFKGLLINQALNEPFDSYSNSLLCDRAIAISVPYEDDDKYNLRSGGIEPYTTSTALSSGWAWKTPLVGRSGNGYVYASDFISEEKAESEFRQHLGNKANNIKSRHIRMRVGKTQNSWVKNCVSIGLSDGFIEPLESTGIYLIEIALYNLICHFPDKNFNSSVIKKFNRIINDYYEEIKDFIVMHYCLTNRDDTAFWQNNKYNLLIPQTLKDKLDFWREILPSRNDPFLGKLFSEHAYIFIFDGMDHLPRESFPLLNYQTDQSLFISKNNVNDLMRTYFNHSDYIKKNFV